MLGKRGIDEVEEECFYGKRTQRTKIHTEAHQKTVAFLMSAQKQNHLTYSQDSQDSLQSLLQDSNVLSQMDTDTDTGCDTWKQKPYW